MIFVVDEIITKWINDKISVFCFLPFCIFHFFPTLINTYNARKQNKTTKTKLNWPGFFSFYPAAVADKCFFNDSLSICCVCVCSFIFCCWNKIIIFSFWNRSRASRKMIDFSFFVFQLMMMKSSFFVFAFIIVDVLLWNWPKLSMMVMVMVKILAGSLNFGNDEKKFGIYFGSFFLSLLLLFHFILIQMEHQHKKHTWKIIISRLGFYFVHWPFTFFRYNFFPRKNRKGSTYWYLPKKRKRFDDDSGLFVFVSLVHHYDDTQSHYTQFLFDVKKYDYYFQQKKNSITKHSSAENSTFQFFFLFSILKNPLF